MPTDTILRPVSEKIASGKTEPPYLASHTDVDGAGGYDPVLSSVVCSWHLLIFSKHLMVFNDFGVYVLVSPSRCYPENFKKFPKNEFYSFGVGHLRLYRKISYNEGASRPNDRGACAPECASFSIVPCTRVTSWNQMFRLYPEPHHKPTA